MHADTECTLTSHRHRTSHTHCGWNSSARQRWNRSDADDEEDRRAAYCWDAATELTTSQRNSQRRGYRERLPTRAATTPVIDGTDGSCVRRRSPSSDRYVRRQWHCWLLPNTDRRHWHRTEYCHSQLDRQTHSHAGL